MKKNRLSLFGILFFGLLLLTGCYKDNKINKNLWKNGGKWTIVSHEETTTKSNNDNSHVVNVNMGSLVFEKNGSGTLTITDGVNSLTTSFTYSNTEDKLILTQNNENIAYNMEWSKDNLELTHQSSRQEYINSEVVDITYFSVIKLEKDK